MKQKKKRRKKKKKKESRKWACFDRILLSRHIKDGVVVGNGGSFMDRCGRIFSWIFWIRVELYLWPMKWSGLVFDLGQLLVSWLV